MSEEYDLLIIGGGPKGAALAAKHHAISSCHQARSRFLVVERKQIGAHWSGKHGYTDGSQSLVSPPEHDVGYPYKSFRTFSGGKQIDGAMQKLSWESFLIDNRERDSWLVRGQVRPTHSKFVEYLQWVANKVDLKHKRANVISIDIEEGKWRVQLEEEDGKQSVCAACGLVVTGHGGPRRIGGGKHYANQRLLDGRDFWDALQTTLSNIKPGELIGVVGAGETAGAIALAILSLIENKCRADLEFYLAPPEIMLICNQPGYFLRSDVSKDLRYFSDPIEWNKLNFAQRMGIIRRADRGVVSNHVKTRLEESALVSCGESGMAGCL